MIKKLIVFFFILFGMISIANAVLNDSQAYYSFDDDPGNLVDQSGNNGDLINNGALLNVIGKINEGIDFDGTNDYITTGDLLMDGDSTFTISFWLNSDSLSGTQIIMSGEGTTTERYPDFILNSDGSLSFGTNNVDSRATTNPGTITTGTWYHIVGVADSTTQRLYINGISIINNSITNPSDFSNNGMRFGMRGDGTLPYNGKLDEIAIYNRTINQSEISELYNSGDGFNPYEQQEAKITFNTPTEGQYFNNTNFTLNVSFSEITNSTYELNNGSIITLGTNENESTASLVGVEGLNNITVFTNTSGLLSNSSITFTIDTANPTITNNIPLEINSYFLDFNSSTCSDINLDTCILEIQNQTYNLLNTTNTTLSLNGNLSYTIFAEDFSGNTANQSGFLFVDPFVYFYFENSITNDDISNYQVNGFQVNNSEYKRKYFDIFTNSTQTFNFVKNGYETTDFQVEMLNNETINETFNITPVTLFVRVYDGETFNQINFNITIENGNITSYENLAVFNESYPNIPLGDIKLIINSNNYSQAVYYTTLESNTSLTFDVYLTPEDLTSIITFNVRDFSTNNLLGDVLIEARRIINDSRVTTQQTTTDGNGLAYLYLDGLKDYDFVFSRDGYVSSTISSIPGVTTYTVKLVSDSTTYSYIDDVSYRLTPNTASIYGGSNVTFKGFISSDSLSQSRLTITDDLGNILFEQTSTNPLGTEFEFTKEFLNETNISKVTMTLSYIVNGIDKEVSKVYSVFSISDSAVEDFNDFGADTSEESRLLRFFIIITSFATFIILGGRNQTTRDYISLITLIPLFIFTFVGWIPYLYATIMTLILIVFFMGGNKR